MPREEQTRSIPPLPYDNVFQVVSSSVYALGSIVQNGMLDKRNELVESIMTNVWELYEKDNLLVYCIFYFV